MSQGKGVLFWLITFKKIHMNMITILNGLYMII